MLQSKLAAFKAPLSTTKLYYVTAIASNRNNTHSEFVSSISKSIVVFLEVKKQNNKTSQVPRSHLLEDRHDRDNKSTTVVISSSLAKTS